jgi:hypothetical protein
MAFEIEQPVDAGPSPVVEPIKPRLLGVLGSRGRPMTTRAGSRPTRRPARSSGTR